MRIAEWVSREVRNTSMFRIATSLLLASTIQFMPTITCAAAPTLELHLAVDGDDSRNGELGQPFATIQRALDEVAHRRANGEQRDVEIILHDGVYWLAEPLKIDNRHTSANAKLMVRADRDAHALISGGRRITDWKQDTNGTFSTKLDDVAAGRWRFRELFVSGERRPRARHPSEGQFLRVGEAFSDKRFGFTFTPGDIPSACGPGAELVFLHDWSISRVAVKLLDHQAGQLTTESPIGVGADFFRIDAFESHPRYFLENHPALLDAPGEWFLDERTGVLTYLPLPGETADSLEAVAPAAPALVIARGSDGSPLLNVHFRGVRFAHTAWALPPGGYAGSQATVHERRDGKEGAKMIDAAVTFEMAEDCSLVDCRIAHLGTSGVAFGSRTHRCKIEGCVFDDISGNCVNLGETASRTIDGRRWWQAAADQAASHHVVANNRIQRGGRQFFGAVGIWIGLACDIRVEHNEIAELPYTGVSVGWMWNPTPTPAANNRIGHNHIHHVMQVLSDGGGIYTLGRQPGSSLNGNHIHDVPLNAGRAESNGMFLDEGTDQLTISGNLIYGTVRSPLRFHQAKDNLVEKNVLVSPDSDTPAIRYNSTDPKTIRQADNTEMENINAAGPEPSYRDRLKD